MPARKLTLLFAVMVVGPVALLYARAQLPATTPQVAAGHPVTLTELLATVGQTCNCFFTVEDAWDPVAWEKTKVADNLMGILLPADLLGKPPREAMEGARSVFPNLSYKLDPINGRIVHIVDNRLVGRKGYVLDDRVGPFEYKGLLCQLPRALADAGVNVWPFIPGVTGELGDYQTVVHVKGDSMTVRTAVTDFIPLNSGRRGAVLWIAETSLGPSRGKDSATSIRFLF